MARKFQILNRSRLRTLKPGVVLQEQGIVVRKLADGDLRFSVNVMVDGQRIHRVVGRESEGVTREQAERLIEKLRTDAREDRLGLTAGRKLHRSFADAADQYIEKMETIGGRDMANKKRHLLQRLVPALGSERLDKITENRLKQYRRTRRDGGASEATINRELATLSHLLRRAASKDWHWLKSEAVPKIPKGKEPRKKIRILTTEQCTSLLAAAVADQDTRAWLFVMFGLNCAMRHGEILRRRYDEVDFDNCRIWIDKAKAGEREQPITPSLRDSLRRQRTMEDDPNGWIFPSMRKGSRFPHRRDMREPFVRIVERAKLDPAQCTPHIMRHTAISMLVMARTDIPTIQKISGHKTPAMVLHYVHLFGEHIDNAISTLDIGVAGATTQELHTAGGPDADELTTVVPITSSKSVA